MLSPIADLQLIKGKGLCMCAHLAWTIATLQEHSMGSVLRLLEKTCARLAHSDCWDGTPAQDPRQDWRLGLRSYNNWQPSSASATRASPMLS